METDFGRKVDAIWLDSGGDLDGDGDHGRGAGPL